jgi:hypothetical protein
MRAHSLVALAALAVPAALPTQQPFHGCPVAGDAATPTLRALNRLKNRTSAPGPADVDTAVTLAAILRLGTDRSRWDERRAATIVGYVEEVKPGSAESVNCRARDPADRDTHIALVADPADVAGPRRVIVEVTPRWRAMMAARGEDWSTRALRRAYLGRWVRVTGWLLFDAEHADAAENTAPGRARDWRATAWEIHPVTSFAVVARPR